jgi:hypothetical protein
LLVSLAIVPELRVARQQMKTRKAFVDCSILTPTMPLDSAIPTPTTTTAGVTVTTSGIPTNATRRRSLSLAEPQPSVETVIVKAKRAAQSLWMLLHAQVRHIITFNGYVASLRPPISHVFRIILPCITPPPPLLPVRAARWDKDVHTLDVRKRNSYIYI